MSSQDQTNHTDYTQNPADFNDYVIAIIDDREEAKRAAQALHDAGFVTGDIVLSPEAKKNAPTLQQSPGVEDSLAEPPTAGKKLFTEEGIDQEEYTEERAKHHVVVRVNTPRNDLVEPARSVLATHHAYAIRHVGQWTREILSDEPHPQG